MLQRLKNLLGSIVDWFTKSAAGAGSQVAQVAKNGTERARTGFRAARGGLAVLGILGAGGYVIYLYPPVKTVGRGDVGVRTSRLSGEVTEWRDGSVFVFPGVPKLFRRKLEFITPWLAGSAEYCSILARMRLAMLAGICISALAAAVV